MRLTLLLGLAAAVSASAQYDNPVLRGIRNGVRMAEQVRSAEALRETAETLKTERERIRAETELLREQARQLREQRRASSTSRGSTSGGDQETSVGRAIKELSDAYGDIEPYGKRMIQFKDVFLTPAAELDEDETYLYVLGLYLLARFHDEPEFRTWLASARPSEPAPDPPPAPVRHAVREP